MEALKRPTMNHQLRILCHVFQFQMAGHIDVPAEHTFDLSGLGLLISSLFVERIAYSISQLISTEVLALEFHRGEDKLHYSSSFHDSVLWIQPTPQRSDIYKIPPKKMAEPYENGRLRTSFSSAKLFKVDSSPAI